MTGFEQAIDPVENLISEIIAKRATERPDTTGLIKGIYLRPIDLSHEFHKGKSDLIVNELDSKTQADADKIKAMIYKVQPNRTMESYPMCDCGVTKFRENLTEITGKNCPICHSPVVFQHEKTLEPILWVGVPDGIDYFINPSVWYVLEGAFTGTHCSNKKTFTPWRWLCNPHYPNSPREKLNNILQKGVKDGLLKRDFNWFTNNLQYAVETVAQLTMGELGINQAERVGKLGRYLKLVGSKALTKYIPLPNNLCSVYEQSDGFHKMTGSAKILSCSMSIFNRMQRTPEGSVPLKLSEKDIKLNRKLTLDFTIVMQMYWDNVIRQQIGRKPGLARKDTFGVRPPFTWRTVITAIQGPHSADEIHIPWICAMEVMKPHLISKLTKMGFKPREAFDYIAAHTRIYSPLIDKLFKELIAECPHKGLPSSLIRNPSLYITSNQTVFITKVKTDPDDRTTSIPVLACAGYNGD